jgi:hypothetical protein
MINASDWYWIVANNAAAGVFNSRRGIYVPTADATYQAWLAINARPTTIANEQELLAVLQQQAPNTIMQTATGLIAYAKAKQGKIMAGGISVNVGTGGSPINVEAATDPASIGLLQGAFTIASATPSQTFQWVPSNTAPLTLTAAQITTLFSAVSAFVQATFTTLAGVINAINAGTITTQAQVDTPPSPIPAWPVNS